MRNDYTIELALKEKAEKKFSKEFDDRAESFIYFLSENYVGLSSIADFGDKHFRISEIIKAVKKAYLGEVVPRYIENEINKIIKKNEL